MSAATNTPLPCAAIYVGIIIVSDVYATTYAYITASDYVNCNFFFPPTEWGDKVITSH